MDSPRLLSAVSVLMFLCSYSCISNAVVIEGAGSSYEYISAPGTKWTDASAASHSSTYLGVNGHLVTISSQSENDFVLGLLSGINNSVWLGGSDADTEGQWKWVTGETFWQGGTSGNVGPDISYANWVPSIEPNGSTVENYLTMFGAGVAVVPNFHAPGQWNDIDNVGTGGGEFAIAGYLIEYEVSSIPTPPALWLFGSGLLGLVGMARRK